MANLGNLRKGFTPVGTTTGANWQDSITQYYCDGTANTAQISVGDIVCLTTGGYPDVHAGTTSALPVLGVCVGIPVATANRVDGVTTDSLSTGSISDLNPACNHLNATTAGYILVADDPNLIVEAASDGATLAATDVGNTIQPIAPAADATTGMSAALIDDNQAGSPTVTDALLILGLMDVPGNAYGTAWSATAQHTRFRCKINHHVYATHAGDSA